MPHTLQDGPIHQVGLGVEIRFFDTGVARLGQPDSQQLALVVPVVKRLVGGQALVALQPK